MARWLAALLAPAAGCSWAFDSDRFQGGSSITGEDAGGDVATRDVAQGDAQGDASGSSACHGTFFDDFDTAPLGTRWDALIRQGTELDLDTSSSVSKPNALRVDLAADVTSNPSLKKTFPPTKTLCCEFDVRLERAANAIILLEGDDAFWLFVNAGASTTFRQRHYREGGAGGVETFGTFDLASNGDAWRHVVMKARFPQAGLGSIEILLDGALAAKEPIGHEMSSVTLRAVSIGAFETTAATTPRRYRFDNFGCTAQ